MKSAEGQFLPCLIKLENTDMAAGFSSSKLTEPALLFPKEFIYLRETRAGGGDRLLEEEREDDPLNREP